MQPVSKLEFEYPIYALTPLPNDHVAICGGGGLMKSGIPNECTVLHVDPHTGVLTTRTTIALSNIAVSLAAVQLSASKAQLHVVLDKGLKMYTVALGGAHCKARPSSRFLYDVQVSTKVEQTVVVASADGKRLLLADETGSIVGLSLPRCALTFQAQLHNAYITSLAVSPDGTLAASSARDRSSFVWDAASGSILQSLSPATAKASVRAIKFVQSESGKLFLLVGESTTSDAYLSVYAFDPTNRAFSLRLSQTVFHSPLISLFAQPAKDSGLDCLYVAVATSECHICFVKYYVAANVARLFSNTFPIFRLNINKDYAPHHLPVSAMCFVAGGRFLVAASADKAITVWSTSKQRGVSTQHHRNVSTLCSILAIGVLSVFVYYIYLAVQRTSKIRHQRRQEQLLIQREKEQMVANQSDDLDAYGYTGHYAQSGDRGDRRQIHTWCKANHLLVDYCHPVSASDVLRNEHLSTSSLHAICEAHSSAPHSERPQRKDKEFHIGQQGASDQGDPSYRGKIEGDETNPHFDDNPDRARRHNRRRMMQQRRREAEQARDPPQKPADYNEGAKLNEDSMPSYHEQRRDNAADNEIPNQQPTDAAGEEAFASTPAPTMPDEEKQREMPSQAGYREQRQYNDADNESLSKESADAMVDQAYDSTPAPSVSVGETQRAPDEHHDAKQPPPTHESDKEARETIYSTEDSLRSSQEDAQGPTQEDVEQEQSPAPATELDNQNDIASKEERYDKALESPAQSQSVQSKPNQEINTLEESEEAVDLANDSDVDPAASTGVSSSAEVSRTEEDMGKHNAEDNLRDVTKIEENDDADQEDNYDYEAMEDEYDEDEEYPDNEEEEYITPHATKPQYPERSDTNTLTQSEDERGDSIVEDEHRMDSFTAAPASSRTPSPSLQPPTTSPDTGASHSAETTEVASPSAPADGRYERSEPPSSRYHEHRGTIYNDEDATATIPSSDMSEQRVEDDGFNDVDTTPPIVSEQQLESQQKYSQPTLTGSEMARDSASVGEDKSAQTAGEQSRLEGEAIRKEGVDDNGDDSAEHVANTTPVPSFARETPSMHSADGEQRVEAPVDDKEDEFSGRATTSAPHETPAAEMTPTPSPSGNVAQDGAQDQQDDDVDMSDAVPERAPHETLAPRDTPAPRETPAPWETRPPSEPTPNVPREDAGISVRRTWKLFMRPSMSTPRPRNWDWKEDPDAKGKEGTKAQINRMMSMLRR